MGFPKVFARRLRYTKGTNFYYYKNYAALVGVLLSSACAIAFRYTDIVKDFRKDFEQGVYDNDPGFEMRRLTMSLGPFVSITSSQDTLEEREEAKKSVEHITVGGLK